MNRIYNIVWNHAVGWTVTSEFGRGRKKSSSPRRRLALAGLAIVSSFAVPGVYAVDYTSPFLASAGEHKILQSGDTVTVSGLSNSGAVVASGSHAQVSANGATITVTGDSTYGGFVENGGALDFVDTDITAQGYGIFGDGGSVTLTDGVIVSTGGAASGSGGVAIKNGDMTLSGTKIVTEGAWSEGVFGAASSLDISNADVQTLGDYSVAISVAAGSSASVKNSTIKTQGLAAFGLAMSGNSLTVTDTEISTQGDAAAGLYAYLGHTDMNGGKITTTGKGAHGALIEQGASVTLTNVNIGVSGEDAQGVLVNGSTDVELNNVTITSGASASSVNDRTSGVLVKGNGASVKVTDSHIIMDALLADGVRAEENATATIAGGSITSQSGNLVALHAKGDGAQIDASGLMIKLDGDSANGVVTSGASKVTLDGVTISATGKTAYGIHVGTSISSAVFSPNGVVEANDTTIHMTGQGSYGALVRDGSSALLTGSRITMEGDSATGVMLQSYGTSGAENYDGPRISIKQSSIVTKGNDSYGTFSSTLGGLNETVLNLETVSIDTEGSGSHGLTTIGDNNRVEGDGVFIHAKGEYASGVVQMMENGDCGGISLKNSRIMSDKFDAITIYASQNGEIALIGSEVSVGTGSVLNVDGASNARLLADSSVLNGNISVTDGSQLDATLSNGTRWNGATQSDFALTMNDSRWVMQEDSLIGSLTANASTIAFDAPAAGAFKTLTMGALAGSGATFVLNAVLNDGDANSQSDRVHITGDASGNHTLVINNAGGLGALTTGDGIQVVQIDGGSTGGFTLGNTVSAGAYQYLLYQGGSVDDNDWYLRSYLDVTPPTPDPDPNVTEPKPKPQILYRPEVAGYAVAPYLNQQYGFDTVGTFHERRGDSVVRRKDGAWGRISGQHLENESGRFGYKTDTWFAQLGADVYESVSASGVRTVGGVMMTLGHQRTDARDSVRRLSSELSAHTGKVDSNGYGLGAYYSMSMENGAYLDLTGQGTYYRNDYSSDRNAKQNGYGVVASIEAGHAFALGNGWSVEPQAQLMYQYLNLDGFSDDVSSVSGVAENSARARGGLRIVKEMQGVKPYVTMDVVHNLTDSPDVRVADVKMKTDFTETWWRIGTGVSADLSDRVSVYGDVKYQKDASSDVDGYGGSLGIKIQF